MRSAWPRSMASWMWKVRPSGGDKAGGELAGVERDVDLGIDGVEVVEHLHLEAVVLHGDAAVFGHDEIEADDVGVSGGYFKAQEGLGEDLLGREAAEDLVEPMDGDEAGWAEIFFATHRR